MWDAIIVRMQDLLMDDFQKLNKLVDRRQDNPSLTVVDISNNG